MNLKFSDSVHNISRSNRLSSGLVLHTASKKASDEDASKRRFTLAETNSTKNKVKSALKEFNQRQTNMTSVRNSTIIKSASNINYIKQEDSKTNIEDMKQHLT